MELRTKLLFAIPILAILLLMTVPVAKAWDYDGSCGRNGGCGYHHFHFWNGGSCGWGNCGNHDWNNGCGLGDCAYHVSCGSCDEGIGISSFQSEGYQSGFYQGQQDAVYDHENNLVYSDQPACLSCHSQSYLEGFRSGYSQQYNTYQNQESTQGTNININGNNNYVSTNQVSNQQQNPLQQLAHTLCGLVNCNGLAGSGYVGNGPIETQGIGYGQ